MDLRKWPAVSTEYEYGRGTAAHASLADYDTYIMSLKEKLLCIFMAGRDLFATG